jgi:hypothetical protein
VREKKRLRETSRKRERERKRRAWYSHFSLENHGIGEGAQLITKIDLP